MTAVDPNHIPFEGVIGSRVSGALPESVAQPSSILVTVEGSARQTLEQARTRLLVVGALFTLALLVVSGKLVGLAVLGPGENNHAHYAPPPVQPVRADIVDRNGKVLATSIATASLFADPAKIIDPEDAARQLTGEFPDTSYSEFLEKLRGKSRFAWLRRHLTPRQQYAVNQMGIPGIGFRPDERRLYPEGREVAQVIGFTDPDSIGLAGIEKSRNDLLAAGGAPVALSIDVRLQHMLHREVQAQIDEFNAVGGGGLIMDTHTGEILAMVSLPDFDPEQPNAEPKPPEGEPDPHFNRMTLGVYEMGSIFKVFNTAMVLDSGKVKISDYFDAFHPIKIGRYTIHDFKGDELPGYSSVPMIFEISSNIGSAQMAKQVGPEAQEQFMDELGLTTKMKLEVPEVGTPGVPHPWRFINMLTIAFGHGISVTPVQLVSAICAIANGGTLRPATLLKLPDGVEVSGRRVISEDTSATMRKLMRLVVSGDRGTAKKFGEVPGYLVGGKTGTAEKIMKGAYAKKHANLSSFVGVFPMNDPRYAVFVTIDEPRGNKHSAGFETGGWVAAPAVNRVITSMGPLLQIPPVDEHSPVIQAKMEIDVNPPGRRIAPN
ncbi:MAG TPA: penicillin-binding protein 2 [Alphaproteobacteria bacterium]|nr:penicillin-binding protein 2 [Alphaproteobacteria bacterium]